MFRLKINKAFKSLRIHTLAAAIVLPLAFGVLTVSAQIKAGGGYHGGRLTANQVTVELEARLNAGFDEVSIWNTGYDFFRNHPRNQDTAMAIYLGFSRAKGGNREQRQIMVNAAAYWKNIHDRGITNVPVGAESMKRGFIYWYDRELGYMPMKQPSGGKAVYQRSRGKPIRKKQPLYPGVRPRSPYPGDHYSGVYPPDQPMPKKNAD